MTIPIYVCNADMSLLLEQTSNRGEWAVPCLQTGILFFKRDSIHPSQVVIHNTFCLAGLQREPGGLQAADHGGDGPHQGGEEAERSGSSHFFILKLTD